MQNQHRNSGTIPAKMPVPNLGNGAFSGWKHQQALQKNNLHDQVAQENCQSGHTSVQSLDSATWLVGNRTIQGRQSGSSQ